MDILSRIASFGAIMANHFQEETILDIRLVVSLSNGLTQKVYLNNLLYTMFQRLPSVQVDCAYDYLFRRITKFSWTV